MTKALADKQIRSVVQQALEKDRQQRAVTTSRMELRDAGGDTWLFTGYATTFDSEYEVWGGPPWGWTESVNSGAFTKTLSEGADVRFLVNHEGLPLARTKSGTLELKEDSLGLFSQAPLLKTDPDVQRLKPKMDRGDINQMSFGFYVVRQEWNDDYTRRWLVELNLNDGDVSVVTYPANTATSADLRSSLAILTERLSHDPNKVIAELRSGGADPLQLVRQAHRGLGHLVLAIRETEVGDADEDPGTVAQAVDAAIDEALEAWTDNPDQALALVQAAEIAVDALLDLLGVEDADDVDEPTETDEAARAANRKALAQRLLDRLPDSGGIKAADTPPLVLAQRQLELMRRRAQTF